MRRLAPEEAALWQKVIASVTPLPDKRKAAEAMRAALDAGQAAPPPSPPPMPPGEMPKRPKVMAPVVPAAPAPRSAQSANTLDGSWDKQIARGLVSPESSIDLHGHSLASAYDRLDWGLEHAILRGDRVLLLVTGKPPRPEAERPHARGAIRAAVGDWLASSRHSSRIAAVRNAHPRHGGNGALYIVLRRPDVRANVKKF